MKKTHKSEVEFNICKAAKNDLLKLKSKPKCAPEYEIVTLNFVKTEMPDTVKFDGSGRTLCEYTKFKMFLHTLSLFGYTARTPSKKEEKIEAKKSEKEINKPIKITSIYKNYKNVPKKITIEDTTKIEENGRLDQIKKTTEFDLSAIEEENGLYPSKKISELNIKEIGEIRDELSLRSPEGMIYFLGQLIAAQNYNPLGLEHQPTIHVYKERGYRPVELFDVRIGASTSAVVSIVDDEGQRFYIPKPDYGSPNEARSMSALSLISNVISLQTTESEIPKTSTLRVSVD